METAAFAQIQENEQESICGGFNGGEFAAGVLLMTLGVVGQVYCPELLGFNMDVYTSGFGIASKGCFD